MTGKIISLPDSTKKLREKLISIALSSREFKNALKSASEEMRQRSVKASNEATVEGIFERVLYATLLEIGIKFHPEKEAIVETRRHTGFGRTDSRLGGLVIEYKHHKKLKTKKDIQSAKKQLEGYLSAISEKLSNEVCGFLTDGISLYEIRAMSGEIISHSGKSIISDSTLLRIARCIISLDHMALTAKNLIRDFCGESYDGVLFECAKILNSILFEKSTEKTEMLRSEWEELFRLSHDDQSQQSRIEERRKVLSEIFEERLNDATSEYRALFALHTAYAIVLKIIAYRVVSELRFGKVSQNYRSYIDADSQVLRAFCSDLEDGEIFRQLGILNLLEGDFFSWYSDENQWNNELSVAIKKVFEILSRYEEVKNIFSSADAVDLFRELYEAIVPQVVRASFGEFYTPFWLAEHVLESSTPVEKWKALDPCCGSGTFVIAAISRIRKERKDLPKRELLSEILERVAAMDLNPLSVLTTRVHYFIHIADLLPSNVHDLIIPVYLGDSSYVPEEIIISGVPCLKYQLKTLKNPITIKIPISLVGKTAYFFRLMQEYEKRVKRQDGEAASSLLVEALNQDERVSEIQEHIKQLSAQLVELEEKRWNGIWARIVTNFLTTACLPKFTNIIGNPPWIDWKNLPAGYREKIKSLCIDRGLFSGAGRTGGINLNICALIAHVSATNWLAEDGRLAFLMPKELAIQASYEGWRRAVGGEGRGLLKFHDWSNAGHPFDPVKEDFMTYVIGKSGSSGIPIPVIEYVNRRGGTKKAHEWLNWEEAEKNLKTTSLKAKQLIKNSTIYTFGKDNDQLYKFAKIAGGCAYIGREGIEFYPQELLLFTFDRPGPNAGMAFVKNIQVSKSKYKIPSQCILLETKFLYPLVKGPAIGMFTHNYKGLIVPFPYDESDPMRPLDIENLENESPLLLRYYKKYEHIIRAQTSFSDKIRGQDPGEFYGLARTGPYTFHNVYVTFRDNTKLCAVVVDSTEMPWGEEKRFLFQNHAVSICERKDGSDFIDKEEAHYVCAILNAPIVREFIYSSSDTRSFKIRPPVFIPLFDIDNQKHIQLSELSYRAHELEADIDNILEEIDQIYLQICEDNPSIAQ